MYNVEGKISFLTFYTYCLKKNGMKSAFSKIKEFKCILKFESLDLELTWHCIPQLHNTHNVRTVRKTLAEIDREGQLLPDGTLLV